MTKQYGNGLSDLQLGALNDSAKALKFFKMQIALLEIAKNYSECLQIYLTSLQIQKGIFEWLKKLHALYGSYDSEPIQKLKDSLLQNIKKLVLINSVETAGIIDIWLPKQ